MTKLLGKIRSLKLGNGDVFFVGVARVFMAQCKIPIFHESTFVAEGERDNTYENSPIKV